MSFYDEAFVDFFREWASRELTESAVELAGCKRDVAFFADKRTALTGAFVNRLTIALVIGAVIGSP